MYTINNNNIDNLLKDLEREIKIYNNYLKTIKRRKFLLESKIRTYQQYIDNLKDENEYKNKSLLLNKIKYQIN